MVKHVMIASPWIHLHGHHLSYTRHLVSAASRRAQTVHLATFWKTKRFQEATSQSGSMPVPSLAVLNTSAAKIFSTTWCLAEVLFRQLILRRAEVCHFIDASHAPLLIAVLLFKLRVTYLVLGEAKKDKYLSLWRLALRSGRIKLIVETAEVKKSWDEINRDSVFEIPVAVSSIGSDCIQEHCRQELGIPLDAYVLLFFGTHRESKDYVTPLQGVLRFASSERPWLLFAGPVISGDDPGLLVRNSALKEA